MKLVTYNKADYPHAFQAESEQAIIPLCDLKTVGNEIELATLNTAKQIELDQLCKTAFNAFRVDGSEETMIFVLVDDNGKLCFEHGESGEWEALLTRSQINEMESIEAIQRLEKYEYRMYVTGSDGNYIVNCVNANGDVSSTNTSIGDDCDIRINGETFDFYLRRTDENEFYLDVFPLITNEHDEMVKDVLCDYTIDCLFVAPAIVNQVAISNKNELIDAQLKRIEATSEYYSSPSDPRTEHKGDDVWQALFELRKIIGIGVDGYEAELENARN